MRFPASLPALVASLLAACGGVHSNHPIDEDAAIFTIEEADDPDSRAWIADHAETALASIPELAIASDHPVDIAVNAYFDSVTPSLVSLALAEILSADDLRDSAMVLRTETNRNAAALADAIAASQGGDSVVDAEAAELCLETRDLCRQDAAAFSSALLCAVDFAGCIGDSATP